MFELGKKQPLLIVKELDFGVYLGETLNAAIEDRVLLPKKQVPQGSGLGDSVEVFCTRIPRTGLSRRQTHRF